MVLPYIENYTNPRNEYKKYFTGKFEEPAATPPAVPPKKDQPPAAKASSEENKFRLMMNDLGKVTVEKIGLGEIVAMSAKGKIYLVTSDEKGNLLII